MKEHEGEEKIIKEQGCGRYKKMESKPSARSGHLYCTGVLLTGTDLYRLGVASICFPSIVRVARKEDSPISLTDRATCISNALHAECWAQALDRNNQTSPVKAKGIEYKDGVRAAVRGAVPSYLIRPMGPKTDLQEQHEKANYKYSGPPE